MEPECKIFNIERLSQELEALRQQKSRIVHCHGVFDLLHVGHIKHFQAAKKMGDVLVVTLTPDRFVNKGPHRPAFPERLRAEAVAALECVDYVAINEWPTAVETISRLRPDLYVKGSVTDKGKRDHTNAIRDEEDAVRKMGGKLILTDEETFSASYLINRHLSLFSPETRAFLADFQKRYSDEQIVAYLESIRPLKVLTIGETIVDEYQFCSPMAMANKDPILAVRYLETEKYAGGILAAANHVGEFCDDVQLLSMLGEIDAQEQFVRAHLKPNVRAEFISKKGSPTIVKRRFVDKGREQKLFEVYVMAHEQMSPNEENDFCDSLNRSLPDADVVIVVDYGHGLMTPKAISLVCEKAKFLALNVQANAGNKGFNVISKYPRADFVCVAEPEVRLETRDPDADLKKLTVALASRLQCKNFMVTRGRQGTLYHSPSSGDSEVPAFAVKVVDRIGAGDAVLSITAPCVAKGVPPEVVGFIANVVGAEACMVMGNKSSMDRSGLYRYITSLMK